MVIKTMLLGTALSVLVIPAFGQSKTDSLKQLLTSSGGNQKFTIYRTLFDEYLHTHPDSSLYFLNKGFLELDHPTYEDSGYYSLLNGNYHSSTGEIEASKQHYINAIRYFRNSPDTSLVLKPMKNLGAALFYQGDIDTAIHIQENAFSYYEATENWKECAYTKNNIGVFYKTQGKFLLAIENYQIAATYFERIGLQEGLSTIYNNIGSLYVEMDRSDVAKTYFQRALDVKLEDRSRQDMGRLLLNMGIVLNDLGDPDSSLLQLKKAKSLFLESKDSIQLAHCYNEIGSVYLDLDSVNNAVGFFKKAVRMAKSIGDLRGQIHYTNYLGMGLFESQKNAETKRLLRANIVQSEKVGSMVNVAMAHDILSDVLEKEGDFQKSLEHYKRSAEISDSLKSEQVHLRTDELATLMELNKHQNLIAQQKNQILRQQADYRSKTLSTYFTVAIIFLILMALIMYLRYANARKNKFVLKSQIDIIKNQLSPHFLYNSLNMVSSLIQKNKDKAQDTIHSLSRLYQYTLECFEEDLIPIEDELKLLNEYLKIIEERFNKMVKLKINSDNLHQLAVVPMSLQLLMENAIKHNTFCEKEPLFISIDAGDKWIFVKNNKNERIGHVVSTGRGVSLLNERYKLLTGKEIQIERLEHHYMAKLPALQLANI